jgi:hypothetical protein
MLSTTRVIAVLASIIAMAAWGAAVADEPPIRTFAAFNTTIYYRYTCVNDVFTLTFGAQNQLATGGETELYWEVWDSGWTTSGEVDPIAELNTLAITPVGTPLDAGFPKKHVIVTIPRMCVGQSLYLWAASGARPLPDGSASVQFVNAAEQPLPLPTP